MPDFSLHITLLIKQLCHLVAQFKMCFLKTHVSTMGSFKNETKINVNKPSLAAFMKICNGYFMNFPT